MSLRLPTILAVLVALAGAGLPPARAGRAEEVRVRSFELLNEGVAAYHRGEFALAVTKLRESASIALNSFRVQYYLGLALIGDRRYQEAHDTLVVALDLDPIHLQSLVALGDALLLLGDIDESRAAYHRALKVRPAHAPALDGLARTHDSQADSDVAIAHYRQAIQSDPGFVPAYTHLGDLYLGLDRMEEALQLLEEAISIRPDYAPGLNRLAVAYARLGLDSEAAAAILEAMALEPSNAEHPATLGLVQLERGRNAAAEESFRRALALDPGLPRAREGLAEVARRRGDFATALAEIDTVEGDARLDATSAARVRAFRARLEAERQWVSDLEAAVASGEAGADVYDVLAAIHADRQEWARAAELQAHATDTLPRRRRQAYLLLRAGRIREAHELYGSLVREGDGEAVFNRGVTSALMGDDEAAVAAYTAVLEREPGHARARLYLGNALLRSGRWPEAAGEYRKFLDGNAGAEEAERVRRILKRIDAPAPRPGPDKTAS